jgi:hypothetical protein
MVTFSFPEVKRWVEVKKRQDMDGGHVATSVAQKIMS